jgi:hypothetical protein
MRQDDTVTMRPKNPRRRDRAFLSWAKTQHAPCCICRDAPGAELHHWGRGGMGIKGDDYEVCRVCVDCHGEVAGLGRIAVIRDECLGTWETWADMLEDSHALLVGWICQQDN